MHIDIGWINVEETVIAFNFRGKWSAEDFYSALDEFCSVVQEKSHPVQLVIDFSYSITPPPNLMTLLRYGLRKFPQSIEQAVIISKSNYWQRVFLMLNDAELVPFPFRFVYHADEAYEILEEYLL